jgi:hypothetical protein
MQEQHNHQDASGSAVVLHGLHPGTEETGMSEAQQNGIANEVKHNVPKLPGQALASAVKPKLVVQRLWRAADRQIAESERRMEAEADQIAEREARTLSLLGKLVRELAEIDLSSKRARPASRALRREDPEGEALRGHAIDISEFRAELAHKLDRLRGERGVDGLAGTAFEQRA